MYAVVQTGGKQYTVSPGDLLKIEKLDGNPGDTVVLKDILLINDDKETKVGTPFVENASVNAELVETAKDKKVIVFKFKRRKNYRRRKGHRQLMSVIKIKEILS